MTPTAADAASLRLRIGLIAPPWVPVPPTEYGGTELVVDQLARGLQAAGHDVVLFTTGDATCPVTRHHLHPRALGTDANLRGELPHAIAAHAALVDVDVIHDHTVVGPLWSLALGGGHPPVVTTAHGPMDHLLRPWYATIGGHVDVVAISRNQRDSAPDVSFAGVIHHGIDVDAMPVGRGDGGYALFLGRMSPDKGVHRAIDVARAVGVPLRIAAKLREPDEQAYFEAVVQPLLGPGVVYLGEVGAAEKRRLLGGAVALVNPIRWPEPFGLVMIEALACGTPVLAFAEGAAPEIVDDGVTGFLCADEAAMAAALSRVGDLDRAACRAVAAARFSTRRMVADHVALYRRATRRTPTVIRLPADQPGHPAADAARARA